MPKVINKSRHALSLVAIAAVLAVSAEGEAQAPPKQVKLFIPSPETNPEGAAVEVTDEELAILEAHPGMQRLKRRGWVTVVRGPKGKAPEPPKPSTDEEMVALAEELGSMNVKEATERVGTIEVVEDLHVLLDLEERSSVKSAIKRRIAALSTD